MNVPVSMMASTDGVLGNGYEEVRNLKQLESKLGPYKKQKVFKCCL